MHGFFCATGRDLGSGDSPQNAALFRRHPGDAEDTYFSKKEPCRPRLRFRADVLEPGMQRLSANTVI